MITDKRELYRATKALFRAFHYLQPRMRGGGLAPPMPMNAEALAGCILHGCMSRLVRELQEQASPALTGRMLELDSRSGAR
jgi:hypothetical protein